MRNLIGLLALLLMAGTIWAQQPPSLRIKSGDVPLLADLSVPHQQSIRLSKKLLLLQFEAAPSAQQQSALAAEGVYLLQPVQSNLFTAYIQNETSAERLKKAGVRKLAELLPRQKTDPLLQKAAPPQWASKQTGMVDVWVEFPLLQPASDVVAAVQAQGFTVLDTGLQRYGKLIVRLPFNKLSQLTSLPVVTYVQAAPPPDQPLNNNSRAGSRATLLNASVTAGGRALNGEGMTMGVGDNAFIGDHPDFNGRLINRHFFPVQGHGMHVSGTAAGAGNINELFRGYAPKAAIVSAPFGNIWYNAPIYYNENGMTITNNSYAAYIGCLTNGLYDMSAQVLDQQAFTLPKLLHVFAAGNSGGSSCAPYPTGFGTVVGGYQIAKNVLCVANTSDSGLIANSSSKGPVKDGRIKPEIAAMGSSVVSTWPGNSYAGNGGTSMAAPAVSGGAVLLSQLYKQKNSGQIPDGALIKALLCNGATDRGNAGPDYTYGFGWMNLVRSAAMIDNNWFLQNSIATGSTNTQAITVPANTARLKVMLYWHDPAASLLATNQLVNDLDLEVINPFATTVLPFVLDTLPANVNNTATTGVDRINNIEQIVIENPVAGNYNFRVKGFSVAQGSPQPYVLVYDIIPQSILLTAPTGGSSFTQNEFVKITWDAFGNTTETYKLQYSVDGGTNWIDIVSGLAPARTVYTWQVPAVVTGIAQVRVVQEGSGRSSACGNFTIMGNTTISMQALQCPGYAALQWTAVAGATDYEVLQLRGDGMQVVATTSANNIALNSLSEDSTYWFSVRPRVGGARGRSAVAVAYRPNGGTCAGSISDNDLNLHRIVSPVTGRRFTSSELSSAHAMTIAIKNLDDAAQNSYTASYRINGGLIITENITTSIAAGGTYNHTFTGTANLSAEGAYNIEAWVTNANADINTGNDTLRITVQHLPNAAINLATPFFDNLEGATAAHYTTAVTGLRGINRYDFWATGSNGGLTTQVSNNMAASGNKSFTLGQQVPLNVVSAINNVSGTYNLSTYNAATNDLRLDFQSLFTQTPDLANKVWVRGSDTQPWVLLYQFGPEAIVPFSNIRSLELSDTLAARGQNFTPSFAVRWSQASPQPSVDYYHTFSLDDIRMYEVFNDMQALALDSPVLYNCGLNNNVAVRVRVYNSSKTTLTNIPVRYRIGNGAWVSETVSSLAANTGTAYTFAQRADLSVIGPHTITAIVDLPADTYRGNDTVRSTINNLPLINSFPYLQDFEADNGGFVAAGANNSWAYGTPATAKVNGAASGTKAWKTNLTGGYNDNELSYLYAPCFNIGGMSNPTLSFSVSLDIEDCGTTLCDAAWLEFSGDGITWTKLRANGAGFNWYNVPDSLWSQQNYTRWHVATVPLPKTFPVIRLRWVMVSDGGVTLDGIAVDDIHVYNNDKGISTTASGPITTTVAGTDWVHFEQGGKLVASIQPSGQNLGNTVVQSFINSNPVRFTPTQYYHDRSFTIKPANTTLTDSVSVRLYFTDAEAERLLSATGCAGCGKPTSAYGLSVNKYTTPNKALENDQLTDNNSSGFWNFYNRSNRRLVPFDRGYYAEIKLKDFSEFWFSGNAITGVTPVKMLSFTATKAGNDAQLAWRVEGEQSIIRYDVEMARTTADMQAGKFVVIGSVNAVNGGPAQRQYSFTDEEEFKYGTRWYRLRIVETPTSSTETVMRELQFGDPTVGQIFPNPSGGLFNYVWASAAGSQLRGQVYDATGRLVLRFSQSGTGYLQRMRIDLSTEKYPSGIYILRLQGDGGLKEFKLHKR